MLNFISNEVILYKDGELELPVEVTPDKETVWLNRKQIATLFDRDVKTIGKHINNALKEELDSSVVAKFATTASDGKTYKVDYYNLDMIISVGYRVKSQKGIAFRKWATAILKEYMIQGYAVNEKIISDSTLVAITLLLAESKPEEKEIMINVIMNFLGW